MNKRSDNRRFSSVNDLRMVREEFRNEVKFREQALMSEAGRFGRTLKQSARNSSRRFTQKILFLTFMKLMQRKKSVKK